MYCQGQQNGNTLTVSGIDRRRSSGWEPTKAQEKRKKQVNSLINATAFPLFMAIFVTIVKDGNSFTFFTTLLPLTLIAIVLQIIIAVAVVCKDSITHNDDDTHVDLEAAAKKKRRRFHRPTFNMIIQLLTVLSLTLNLAVNAFFTARELRGDDITVTSLSPKLTHEHDS
jgi:hypothetical protein